ncbi:hypothetical protein GCM10010421_14680 [Streptomyces glaucus]|uniref:Secreted protein n=1 Tax=Streptomyces glaucus TaxID=284029 RepID=A0ABN3JE56_9ACTN
MRSQATYVLVSAVCSRSSASLGFPVSDRAVRSSTGRRALTYDENDGYGKGRVCVAAAAAFEALVQTGVVMAPRYERAGPRGSAASPEAGSPPGCREGFRRTSCRWTGG